MQAQLETLLRFQHAALNLQARRQELLAANIANADTPHYKARDLDFSATLQAVLAHQRGASRMAVTQPAHFTGLPTPSTHAVPLYRLEYQSAVDGNTVEMDVERAAFAESTLRKEASLRFINGTLQTMKTAISGQ